LIADLTAFVLAGGQSRRLGRDKTLLRIAGQTLVAYVVERLAPLCTEVIIVSQRPDLHAHRCARVVGDVYPGKGPLGGIHAGLVHAHTPAIIAVAADMPLVNPAVIARLAQLRDDYDVVIPIVNGFLEPLHAIYTQACRPAMEGILLRSDTPRVVDFFPAVRVREVPATEFLPDDPNLQSFLNINTAADLKRVRAALHAQGLDIEG